eukprot:TRINITY_DN4911_c0_g1_i3.p1 TRINITY_DN4911_c0_g1~~TRINITY_DN4911_c0_g1_i3.p1  ORF type:complete len:176 (+),score=20.65 TRINITY_DN4911_c0_g1_i3:296-823(+)
MDKLEEPMLIKGEQNLAVTSIAFSNDTRSTFVLTVEMATANMDNGVKLYDIANSFTLCLVDSNTVKANKVDFSPSGYELVCGTTSICVISSEDGKLIKEFATDSRFITSLKYSPNGSLIAVGNVDGALLLYKTDSYTRAAKTEDHGLLVRDLVFSPDGKDILSVSDDMHINITDL